MRKLLWLGWGTAVLGCVGGLWVLLATWPTTNYYLVQKNDTAPPAQKAKGEGDSEASDVIEPLIVDPGPPQVIGKGEGDPLEGEFGEELHEVLRAVLEPGMSQPPRPDAETGEKLRMPNADEKVVAEPARPESVAEEKPVEESEPTEPEPPAVDPHDQHCPYMGGRCPAPYPYRTPR